MAEFVMPGPGTSDKNICYVWVNIHSIVDK